MNDATRLPFVEDVAWIRVEDGSAVGRVRRVGGELAARLGFSDPRGAEVALALTEIATNLHKHAKAGLVLIRSVRFGTYGAVEVVAVDTGPGIADLSKARSDGESSVGTLGIGLGAVERLADSLRIASRPGAGTVLAARFQPVRRPCADDLVSGITRAYEGESVCGDAWTVRQRGTTLSLMVCDGSGHGPLAASASQAAVRAFTEQQGDPVYLVGRIHEAMRGTRGGAVAVADLDLAAGRVRFAGVGNIAGAVITADQKRGMISVPGVAGYQARTIRGFDYELPPGAAVVLHSDGLTERWTPRPEDGLLAGSPLLIAATLMRDAGVRKDDACVLVAKPPRA